MTDHQPRSGNRWEHSQAPDEPTGRQPDGSTPGSDREGAGT